MKTIIDKMNELLKTMRETIPTTWEYGHTYFADALYKDLKFEIESAKEKRFVIADGNLVKITYHIDKQATELQISNGYSRELDRSLLSHYQSLCKQLNDYLKEMQNEHIQKLKLSKAIQDTLAEHNENNISAIHYAIQEHEDGDWTIQATDFTISKGNVKEIVDADEYNTSLACDLHELLFNFIDEFKDGDEFSIIELQAK